MPHSHRRRQEIERAARRMQVAALLTAGVTDQTRIAGRLGVHQATVSRDIKIIEAQWHERAVEAIATAKGLDLERVDRLISSIWGAAITGNTAAIDRVLSLLQHRARLLGLNAPERREDTQRIEVALIVERIAQETGLNKEEILAEAERIIRATG